MKTFTRQEILFFRLTVGFIVMLMFMAAYRQNDSGWIAGAILFFLSTMDRTFARIRKVKQ